jgi:Fic family protein
MAGFVTDIQEWMRDCTYPGPVIAALAHFGLISIHPFEDGNGRTARLLADMILQQTHWSNEGMLSVSEAIFNSHDAYYEALRSTQGENFRAEVDVTPFVKFHTDVLCSAASALESTVINFNRRREWYVEQTRGAMNSRQALALMFMVDVAPLSTSTFAELTGVSQATALSDLMEMVERSIVERVGQGRNTRYRVAQELQKQWEEERGRAEGSEKEEVLLA